jgi:DNA-binding FadR family transcriptional regulator
MRNSTRLGADGASAQRAGDVKRPESGNARVLRRADQCAQAIARLRSLLESSPPGSGRLPPERVLSGEFGVSRGAVRQALDLLEAEGRISRQGGAPSCATK